MNLILKYFSQGIQFVFIGFIFSNLLSYDFLISLLVLLSFIIYNKKFHTNAHIETNTNILNSSDLQLFANKLSDIYDIEKIQLHISNDNSGQINYNKSKENTVCVPKDANPYTDSIESKAVIAHEISHLVHKDKNKYKMFTYMLILISTLLLYILPSNLLLTIGVYFIIMLIFPGLRNYISHTFEYRADKFAVEHTSLQAVSSRLRTNKRLLKNPWYRNYFPYIISHPSIDKRLKYIHNL